MTKNKPASSVFQEGPFCVYPDNSVLWWYNGTWHWYDGVPGGPAGTQLWGLENGVLVTQEGAEEWLKRL